MLPNVDFSPIANKLGRFSRVNTHWVSGTALEIRPHGWLVGALPGVNRLISGMKNHCDMRSLLASLLVKPVARLESIEIAISPYYLPASLEQLLDAVMAVSDLLPALRHVVVQSEPSDSVGNDRILFLTRHSRDTLRLHKVAPKLRALGLTLADELGNVWLEEWDSEKPPLRQSKL